MSRGVFRWLAVLLPMVLVHTPASAHHGYTAKFDPDQPVTLEGRVTKVDWANPHAHIFMVVDGEGAGVPWYVELESPLLLELNGWSETSLQPGQEITVSGFLARDGSTQAWGETVVAAGSNEPVFTITENTLSQALERSTNSPTPRWPDGDPRLGPPAGETGYWAPTTTVFMEEGAGVPMAPNGQLEDLADAARVAPLQEWALRLYEFRQRNNLSFDPTYIECRPPAGPRKYLVPFGIQFLEDRALERIFVVSGGGNHDWHLIYTDGRQLNGGFQLDDGNLLYYGRAVGEWQDESFVIESEGFNEKFWLSGGLPHTDQMHLTERLRRPDLNTLEYAVTIDDPGAYTRPWSASWTLEWIPGDPPEYYCQDNRL